MSIIPIYAFYYFSKYDKIDSNWFSIIILLFLLDAFLLNKSSIKTAEVINDNENFINNTGYLWISLLPVTAFLNNRKKIIQYTCIIIISYYVIFSFKRGAIILGLLAMFYFIYQTIRNGSTIKKITTAIIFGLLVFLTINLFNSLLENNEFFYGRIQDTLDGDLSGRDRIWEIAINYIFSNENGLKIIYGNGAHATVRIIGIEAHNDWLEYIFDIGLLGTLCYLIYWISIINNFKYIYKKNNIITTALGMFIIINLGRTLFSMSFNDMSIFSTATLGYCMAIIDNQRKNRQI
jgi:O-antigen ligase